jgi:hypothetical protein
MARHDDRRRLRHMLDHKEAEERRDADKWL